MVGNALVDDGMDESTHVRDHPQDLAESEKRSALEVGGTEGASVPKVRAEEPVRAAGVHARVSV